MVLPIIGATVAGSSGAAGAAGGFGLGGWASLGSTALSSLGSALAGGRYSSKKSGDIKQLSYADWKRTQADHQKFRHWQRQDEERQRARQVWDTNKQYERQIHFAQNSTRWNFEQLMRSADQAGIHRLAALGGATGSAYQPATSGPPPSPGMGSSPGYSTDTSGLPRGDGGNWLGDVIGNVIAQTRAEEREAMANRMAKKEMELLDAQIREIDAATSRTQIQNMRNAGTGVVPQEDGSIPKSDQKSIWMDVGGVKVPNPRTVSGLEEWIAMLVHEGTLDPGIEKAIERNSPGYRQFKKTWNDVMSRSKSAGEWRKTGYRLLYNDFINAFAVKKRKGGNWGM